MCVLNGMWNYWPIISIKLETIKLKYNLIDAIVSLFVWRSSATLLNICLDYLRSI